jgi:FtsP/CotA-like multicopper oxidase with cupredoxin domain
MHLHGHHLLVLSRNGKPVAGSPWRVDILNVKADETYDVAFRANNPGVWMFHCHNLPHSADGLLTHLVYEGVTTPFRIGGDAHNHPD